MKRIFILFVFLISSSTCALADEVLDVKLPPDYKIIVKNQDFPVTLRPNLKNGTFRVVNYQLFYKDKLISQVVENVQIIDGNKVVLKYKTHDMHDPVHVNVDDWVSYSSNELYQNENDTFYKYIIVHGKDKDYLMFMITFPKASEHFPSYLIGYDKDNSKLMLYSDDVPGDLKLFNPKNTNGEYELIDDKYIKCFVFDGMLGYFVQYEIIDNTLRCIDEEYKIEFYNKMPFHPEPKEIMIYSKPSINSNKYKIRVNNDSAVKILGIRFTEDNRFVHVIINGKEGWIEENDSQYIGVGAVSS